MTYLPTTADAIFYTTNAILELYDNDCLAECSTPIDADDDVLGSNSDLDKVYRTKRQPWPRGDEVDIKQFAKGCMTNYLGARCPSDEPFTPKGHSALDVQAGFAIANAVARKGIS